MVGILQTLDKKVGKASSKKYPIIFWALQVPYLQNKVNWDNWGVNGVNGDWGD